MLDLNFQSQPSSELTKGVFWGCREYCRQYINLFSSYYCSSWFFTVFTTQQLGQGTFRAHPLLGFDFPSLFFACPLQRKVYNNMWNLLLSRHCPERRDSWVLILAWPKVSFITLPLNSPVKLPNSKHSAVTDQKVRSFLILCWNFFL